MSARVSAVLITYNDADRIRPCLDSLAWVDEIVVMDLGSTDGTQAICREYTERLHSHAWLPYADPIRNEVIGLATGAWILMLDADERVTPELARALKEVAESDAFDAAMVPYHYMAFGLERTDPLAVTDAIARFFRAGALSWPAEVHARPRLDGLRLARLDPHKGEYLLHDNWRTSDEVLDKIVRYTREEAALMHARGTPFRMTRMCYEVGREVGRGLVYRATQSGMPGLMALGYAVFYRFTVWARLWELQGKSRAADRPIRRWGNVLGALPRLSFRLYRLVHPAPKDLHR
ncbi:MAG: glycosyltransferase family 2 protein [Anaerolineae bacterium]